ncbi:MBL fold metallo-hydrolase [Streptomyces sp. NPDC002138]|uniref:MBL fold metallo-hydrolase n=1 Tax=Streptomyces sp. NPDC002138 TaxID=3154410 RepID=UPI0033335888
MTTVTRGTTPATAPRTLRFGEHTVTWLPDGHVQLDPRRWLPDSTAADWAGRNAALLDPDGFLTASIGALLIRHGDRAMLVDAGFGPHAVPAENTHPALGALVGGQLPAALDAVGVDPAAIELIAFSHLHDDHLGWALRPGPGLASPFVNAAFAASAAEWSHWARPAAGSSRTRTVGGGEEVFPGVTAWPTPGHTAGHTSYVLTSGERRLIAFGDLFHTPAQLARPDWRVVVDAHPERGAEARRALLAELARPGTAGFANHFSGAVFGRLANHSGTPCWEPLEEFY